MRKQLENIGKPLLLIDNKCKLCSNSVKFIANNGGINKFRFLSLYSDEGRKILLKYGFPKDYDKSLILVEEDLVYTKSDAVLRITRKLNGTYPALYWFKFIPKIIRNFVYDIVSKYRYKIHKQRQLY